MKFHSRMWFSVLAGCLLLSVAAAQADPFTTATQRGVDFLTPDVVNWSKGAGCTACHRQGGALFGLATAHHSGYTVDLGSNTGVGYLSSAVAGDQQPDGRWTHGGGLERAKTSWALFGLSGFDRHVTTTYSSNLVAGANWAISQQSGDGHWAEDHNSYPTTYGQIPITARMMVGLSQAKQRVDPITAASFQTALDNAAGYIRANRDNVSNDSDGTYYNYEAAWGVIGLKAAGASNTDPDVLALIARLYSAQSNAGFAWGNIANAYPDPFSTGMVVYAMCLAGETVSGNQPLYDAIQFLVDQQQANGQWGSGGQMDLYTTFAILGLSCFGNLGVEVSVIGADAHVIDCCSANTQTTVYDFQVLNHGASGDTFDLNVFGGMSGWSSSLDVSSVYLGAGQSTTVHLTVNAPANLPQGLPVQMTVVARSQTNPNLSAAARVTTSTSPPPPITGDPTTTTFTSGPGAFLHPNESQLLAAQVTNNRTSDVITGPGKGVVTFSVAGITVGTDDDADGDGTFQLTWNVPSDWSGIGVQDLRAVYSGIDLPGEQPDLVSSLAAGTLTIKICGDGIIEGDEPCDQGLENGGPNSCCTSECTLKSSESLCRTGSGDDCDSDEYCTGDSGSCPTDDAPSKSGSVCRGGNPLVCDADETCTGVPGQSCPADTGSGCHCGDGTVAGTETCDEGANNGADNSCCTSDCQLKEKSGCASACLDALDNDADGNTDANDSGCATLSEDQHFAIIGTKKVVLGSQIEVVRADGSSLSQTAPYPLGPSHAGVCGNELKVISGVQIGGTLAVEAKVDFGSGENTNIGDSFVDNLSTSQKLRGVVPVVGPGNCTDASNFACTQDRNCTTPATCEGLLLTNASNPNVDHTGTHSEYARCAAARSSLLGDAQYLFNLTPESTLDSVSIDPGDSSPFPTANGAGQHVFRAKSVRVSPGATLTISANDPNAIVVIQVEKTLSIAKTAIVNVGGQLKPENLLWVANGKGSVKINGYTTGFAGSILAPERSIKVGQNVTIQGGLYGSKITISGPSSITHRPITTLFQ